MYPEELRPSDVDQRIFLHFTPKQFATFLAMRGDSASPRICFSNGALELMSPSRSHEVIKGLTGQLIEMWAIERDVELVSLGSMTLSDARLRHRGGARRELPDRDGQG